MSQEDEREKKLEDELRLLERWIKNNSINLKDNTKFTIHLLQLQRDLRCELLNIKQKKYE